MGVLSLGIKTLLKETHFFCKTTMEMWREQGRISKIECTNEVSHWIGHKGVPAVWRHTELCLAFFFFSCCMLLSYIYTGYMAESGVGEALECSGLAHPLSLGCLWQASSYRATERQNFQGSPLIWCTSRAFVPASEKPKWQREMSENFVHYFPGGTSHSCIVWNSMISNKSDFSFSF